MAELRFGVVSESVRDGRAWLDHARRIEDTGIDVLLIRDHFSAGAFGQQLAPFTALASAAAVTTRLRVGTIVLSNDFRHPAIVAHEAASLHLVSGGRFELGLGAGWYQPEYDAAGIGFDPAGQRIGRLEESLSIIRALLSGTEVHHSGAWYRVEGLDLDVLPAPRSSPRLLVGAGGPRMLRLAARHADIVGVLPAPIRSSQDDDDDPADRLPPAFDAKLAVLREAAGDRFSKLEINAFGTFVVTDTRRASTEELIRQRGWTGIDAETVWEMPTVFIGSPAQIRDDLIARRARFGLSYLVAAESALPALADGRRRALTQRPNARAIRPARSSSVTVVSTSMTGRPSPVASCRSRAVNIRSRSSRLARALSGSLVFPAILSSEPRCRTRRGGSRASGRARPRGRGRKAAAAPAGQQPEALGDHPRGEPEQVLHDQPEALPAEPAERLEHGLRRSADPPLVHVHGRELGHERAVRGGAAAAVIRHHVVGRVQAQAVPGREPPGDGRLARPAPAADPADVAEPGPQRSAAGARATPYRSSQGLDAGTSRAVRPARLPGCQNPARA